MTMWDELRLALLRIPEESPGALQAYPMPLEHRDDGPPFRIRLAPWAIGVAEELHRTFGDDVELVVGALRYPQETVPGRQVQQLPEELDPGEAVFSLDGSLAVRSGYTAHHELLVRNLTDLPLNLQTNGVVTALVVDPATKEVVGGFTGAQSLPFVQFNAAPDTTERIPLLVGTASFIARLGYAIPPGPWAICIPLKLGDGRDVCTPMLPITVTS